MSEVHPEYDPVAKQWFIGRLARPTIRDLLTVLPIGTTVRDYYPAGYTGVRTGCGGGSVGVLLGISFRHAASTPQVDTRPAPAPIEQLTVLPRKRTKPVDLSDVPEANEDWFRRAILKLPPKPKPPPPAVDYDWAAHTAQLEGLVAEGYTGGQIANLLGISRSAVMGKCHRLGLKLRGMAKV